MEFLGLGFNEAWALLSVLVIFGAQVLAFRLFGTTGLYLWVALATVLANLQVVKTVELFGLTATLGNVLYGSTFLATDVLSENLGKRAANKAVYIGFFTLVLTTVVTQMALAYVPAPDDWAQEPMAALFGFLPRLVLASAAAFLAAQFHDVWAFHAWKTVLPGRKYLWVRNNASTLVSQALDSAIFCFVAFWGEFPEDVFWQILLTTYLFKLAVAVLDTPVVYLMTGRWKHRAQESP